MSDKNDTPVSIEEAFEQASSSLQNEGDSEQEVEDSQTPEDSSGEDQDTETPSSNEETEDEPEDEEEEAESKETPLDKFDPDSLPPELQDVYKNLQKGFTQGRQKDREEVNALKKELEELRGKVSDPDAQDKEEDIDIQKDPEGYVNKVIEEKVLSQKVNDFRDEAVKEYPNLDPRLNQDGDQYDETLDTAVAAKLDKLLDKHVEENGSELGFDYKGHAKRLIQDWDNYLSSHIKNYVSKQKKITREKAKKVVKANPKTSPAEVKPSGKLSLDQAIEAAFSKISK